jgi:hypothetical protein
LFANAGTPKFAALDKVAEEFYDSIFDPALFPFDPGEETIEIGEGRDLTLHCGHFLAVGEVLSFTEAAAQLRLAQPHQKTRPGSERPTERSIFC